MWKTDLSFLFGWVQIIFQNNRIVTEIASEIALWIKCGWKQNEISRESGLPCQIL